MNEQEVLKQLEIISQHLDHSNSLVTENKWDAIENDFATIVDIRDKIKKNQPPVEALMEQSTTFKTEYELLKENILIKTDQVIASIETWKTTHSEKISQSKNVLDNISRYYQPSSSSYYIDRKE